MRVSDPLRGVVANRANERFLENLQPLGGFRA